QRCQLTADAVVPVRREALPFGRIGAESLHAPISDSLPIAENKITGNIQFRRRIRKINKVILADVGAVYIAADFLDQWHSEKVDLASAGRRKQLEAVEERAACPEPVPRPLIAAAVFVVGSKEPIEASK